MNGPNKAQARYVIKNKAHFNILRGAESATLARSGFRGQTAAVEQILVAGEERGSEQLLRGTPHGVSLTPAVVTYDGLGTEPT